MQTGITDYQRQPGCSHGQKIVLEDYCSRKLFKRTTRADQRVGPKYNYRNYYQTEIITERYAQLEQQYVKGHKFTR